MSHTPRAPIFPPISSNPRKSNPRKQNYKAEDNTAEHNNTNSRFKDKIPNSIKYANQLMKRIEKSDAASNPKNEYHQMALASINRELKKEGYRPGGARRTRRNKQVKKYTKKHKKYHNKSKSKSRR